MPFCLFQVSGKSLLEFVVFCSFGESGESLYQLILSTVEVSKFLKEDLDVPIEFIDASERFLSALKGVSDPEAKRKVIGRVFDEETVLRVGEVLERAADFRHRPSFVAGEGG